MKKSVRDSNYELLRVISMFLIILGHVLLHGQVLGHANATIAVIVNFMEALLIVHVNSFILVTGYYQCQSTFKFKKLISINNAAWFYRVVIAVSLLLLNFIDVGRVELIKNLLPVDLGFYWFIDTYLLLYCISPFLNLLIEKMNQAMFKKLLVTLFIVISIVPTITCQEAFNNGSGYSITNFIFLYFIGAYFKLYKISIWDYLKINSAKMKQLVYFSLFILFSVINLVIYFFGSTLINYGDIAQSVGLSITHAVYSYDNPLVIAGAIVYFLWFGCLKFESKFVNKLGTLVFGVYLIHENPYIVRLLYGSIGFGPTMNLNTYMIFPKIILTTLGIFAICSIVEWIRQLLFILISKISLSKKIKSKWYIYLSELKSNF